MLSSDFEKYLDNFETVKKHFQGTYSADNLPKKLKPNSFIICNTDVSSGIGIHWYCVFKHGSNILECFDSLGIDSTKKHFLEEHFNQPKIKKIVFNVTQVQSSSSNTCGLFVLYFALERFFNLDMKFEDLMNEIFVESTEKNESNVRNFYDSHLK